MAIQEIGIDELARRLDSGARLIDVREDDEYTEGHVPGAESWPLSSFESSWREAGLESSGDVLVICRSGGRSLRACEYLADQGVTAVNVAGGTLAWSASGRDVVAGSSPA